MYVRDVHLTRARYDYVAVKCKAEAKNNPSAISNNYNKIYKVESVTSRCVPSNENEITETRRWKKKKNPALQTAGRIQSHNNTGWGGFHCMLYVF